MAAEGGAGGNVAALLAAGQLEQAARLCAERGDDGQAARLFEQACLFSEAARAALRADGDDALRLAVLSGADELVAEVQQALLSRRTPERLDDIARGLLERGYARHAAALWEALGRYSEAAEAFAQCAELLAAARCYLALDKPAPAARVLEAGLRDETHPRPDALRLALGQLYARYGKHQAAVRALQQIDVAGPERAQARSALATSLRALGLREALAELEREMAAAGQAPTPADAPAASGAADVGAVMFGRYLVRREVATTPHARLLEALDQLTQKRVALKLLVASAAGAGRDALQRFLREAQALAQLRHPNVMPLVEVRPAAPAMVLPWMEGGDLAALIERGPIAPARACEIARALLAALAEAHRMGILHRDVKPSNVLFDEAGTAYLADFGAAHLGQSAATVTVGEIGTYAYMAPEQRAARAATAGSDIYGVGAILYEMIAGALPPSIVLATARLSPCHPDLDASHDQLLQRLCAVDPADRPASAHDASKALAGCSWPTRRMPARPGAAGQPQPASAVEAVADLQHADARLLAPIGKGGARLDRLLNRGVLVAPLDEAGIERAGAFARAGHPALPLVLRADRQAGEIWYAAPVGEPVAAVSAADVARIGAALEQLHQHGHAYGGLSLGALRRIDGQLFLGYAPAAASASAEADVRALALLPRA